MSGDILAAIDATVNERCACGCGTALDPAGPSGWFVDAGHQRRYREREATNPGEVYARPDAARVLVGADDVLIPLSEPEERGSDQVDALLYAAWALNNTGPRLSRRPAPELPTTGEPSRWLTEQGFRPAVEGPVAYRRFCAGCHEFTLPADGRLPRPMRLTFPEDPSLITPIESDLCQSCRTCRQRFPGPIMRGQWRETEHFGGYEFHLSGGGTYGLRGVRREMVDFYPEGATRVWEDMEQWIFDLITYSDPCSVRGCDERARGFFTVIWSLEFAGRTWPPGKLDVCPKHEHDLRRLEDYPYRIPRGEWRW